MRRGLIAGTIVLLTAASVIAWSASSARPGHRLVMVARGMAFYTEGRGEPNPPLILPVDTRVTIELRNEDAGITHDLLVESFGSFAGARTKALATDQSDRVAFRTPNQPSETEYVCTFHGQTMRGWIRFE